VHCFYLLQKISLQIKVLGKQNQKNKIKKSAPQKLWMWKRKKFDQ
jgi:hypothetical protein